MSYPGSKAQAGTWQRIIGQMPPHPVYVEPFFGSGQVFFRKRLAVHSVVIDAASSQICKVGFSQFSILNTDPFIGDALAILPTLALPAETVIYCDPPYLLSTRQLRLYYDHEPELHDPDWHARLLALLQALPCRILLSGYPSELYSSTLRDWRCISYRARTRGRTVTECLWCNFPEPTELHDWRYAGKNCRQRLSFKRLSARWLARLDVMPPLKRGYLLESITQRHNERWPRSTPDSASAAVTSTSAVPGVNAGGSVVSGDAISQVHPGSDGFTPPNCSKCGYAHWLSLDCSSKGYCPK
jgi:hypothetical protein